MSSRKVPRMLLVLLVALAVGLIAGAVGAPAEPARATKNYILHLNLRDSSNNAVYVKDSQLNDYGIVRYALWDSQLGDWTGWIDANEGSYAASITCSSVQYDSNPTYWTGDVEDKYTYVYWDITTLANKDGRLGSCTPLTYGG